MVKGVVGGHVIGSGNLEVMIDIDSGWLSYWQRDLTSETTMAARLD